ncbi:hypothetical protein [Methanobrevibacter sp.]
MYSCMVPERYYLIAGVGAFPCRWLDAGGELNIIFLELFSV